MDTYGLTSPHPRIWLTASSTRFRPLLASRQGRWGIVSGADEAIGATGHWRVDRAFARILDVATI